MMGRYSITLFTTNQYAILAFLFKSLSCKLFLYICLSFRNLTNQSLSLHPHLFPQVFFTLPYLVLIFLHSKIHFCFPHHLFHWSISAAFILLLITSEDINCLPFIMQDLSSAVHPGPLAFNVNVNYKCTIHALYRCFLRG